MLDLQSKTIVFCAKYLTNFSPIQYVYNVKSPFVVEKNNIYLKKKILCSHQEVHELKDLSLELSTLVYIISFTLLQSPLQVDMKIAGMKNALRLCNDFVWYSNTLETYRYGGCLNIEI